MDWEGLESIACASVKRSLEDLQARCPHEEIYSCALYTDSGAMTFAVAVNSIEALEVKLGMEDEEEREELRSYYKWTPSEWKYEALSVERFREICTILRGAGDRANLMEFRGRLHVLMRNVLATLRHENFFDKFKIKDPVLFVTITDDDNAEELENKTAEALNSPENSQMFLSRFEI